MSRFSGGTFFYWYHFLNAHFIISFQLGFLPYINIPVRYILAANQVVNMNPAINKTMERPNCHQGTVTGTPNGIRAIITMGELKGMMLAHTASELPGFEMAGVINAMENITSMVMGKLSDCASLMSSLMALPMAAYREE